MAKEIKKEIIEEILCEIKGLMVDIHGKPKVEFETEKQIDLFIDDIEELFVRKNLDYEKTL